jgi:hypothetical protein
MIRLMQEQLQREDKSYMPHSNSTDLIGQSNWIWVGYRLDRGIVMVCFG